MASVAPPIAGSPATSSKYTLTPLPEVPAAAGHRQIIDTFKVAVAQLVGEAWGEDPAKIFEGVDTGKKGADLAVAVPRFKKGKPDEWAEKVKAAFKPNVYLSSVTFEKPFLLFNLK